LGIGIEIRGLIWSLCEMHHDPKLLTTDEKLKVACVEALRFGYVMSKYMGLPVKDFLGGLEMVIKQEDKRDSWNQ
jgi:hypothetical protein